MPQAPAGGLSHTTMAAASAKSGRTTPVAVTGTVVSLDVHSSVPYLQLKDANDKVWTITFGGMNTTVWKHGQTVSLNDLKFGQTVQVRQGLSRGTSTAQSIQILADP